VPRRAVKKLRGRDGCHKIRLSPQRAGIFFGDGGAIRFRLVAAEFGG